MKVEAARVLAGATSVADQAAALIRLRDGRLAIEDATARLAGGTFAGRASLDAAAAQPALGVRADLRGIALAGPAFGLPVDLVSGRVDATLDLTATGYAPAALLATLAGNARITAAGGTLSGISLGTLQGLLAGGQASDEAIGTALAGGTTAFTEAAFGLRVDHGLAEVTDGHLDGPSGTATCRRQR